MKKILEWPKDLVCLPIMKIKILGSGGWEGIPSPFCKCDICLSAKNNPLSKDNRTRPEILVESDEGSFLIEISPDIRLQSTRFDLPLIENFLISHWHFDHLYGILELHAWSEFVMHGNINIFCSSKTKEWIDKTFGYISKNIIELEPYKKFMLCGVEITPIPVYHMESRDKEIKEDELNNVLGYILEKNGKKTVYLGDYYKIPARALDLIKSSDLVIADGTYLFEDLFPDKPMQNELKNDADHIHGKDILKLLADIQAKEVIFHSTTHLSGKNHEELQALLPKNYRISYDGMSI